MKNATLLELQKAIEELNIFKGKQIKPLYRQKQNIGTYRMISSKTNGYRLVQNTDTANGSRVITPICSKRELFIAIQTVLTIDGEK